MFLIIKMFNQWHFFNSESLIMCKKLLFVRSSATNFSPEVVEDCCKHQTCSDKTFNLKPNKLKAKILTIDEVDSMKKYDLTYYC